MNHCMRRLKPGRRSICRGSRVSTANSGISPTTERMRIRSVVGLIPLFAVETLEPRQIERLPGFKRRMQWFIENRPDLTYHVASMEVPGKGERRLLSIVDPEQLRRILRRTLDE